MSVCFTKYVFNSFTILYFVDRTWKFCQIGLDFINLLLRYDAQIPSCAVDLLTQSSVHESLYIRKVSHEFR